MTVLTQFMATDPFIVAGTSLDEIDLDFYLSHRTQITSRDDRGPSIFVEMTDDAITQDVCEKHNLLHFVGYSSDFFKYCIEVLPNPPTPLELIPNETKRFLPNGVSSAMALAFNSAFEVVPASANSTSEATRFLYGHPPSWVDLASDLDVSRPIVGKIVGEIERRTEKTYTPRLVLVCESAGTGKTTALRRAAFELAGRGIRTLWCSALTRITADTASVIDLIEGPLVLVVDDFADQANPISNLLSRTKKEDLVILGAERAYRLRYIKQALGGTRYKLFDNMQLGETEIARLLESYQKFGLVGHHNALRRPGEFARGLTNDPIAVACCLIMNDFKPLDRIASDMVAEVSSKDLDRYLTATIARQCFMGGVRYEILTSAVGNMGLSDQFGRSHALPIASSDYLGNFVVPENATLAERVLTLIAERDRPRLLKVFVALANAIAPRVNRGMIIQRTPEARLSGRLFDFDDTVRKYLREEAFTFYMETRSAWKWNSRYWEQVALLNLATYYEKRNSDEGLTALDQAVQHARHAVSIELHPFPLATLGKVLMTQMLVPGYPMEMVYNEAFERLTKAIELEASWFRTAVQPYVSLFHGTIHYLDGQGTLSNRQASALKGIISSAESQFQHDEEIRVLIDNLLQRPQIQ